METAATKANKKIKAEKVPTFDLLETSYNHNIEYITEGSDAPSEILR